MAKALSEELKAVWKDKILEQRASGLSVPNQYPVSMRKSFEGLSALVEKLFP